MPSCAAQEDGWAVAGALDWLRPGPRVRAALRGALDLALPPQAFDEGGGPVTSPGLTAEAWGRIVFIGDPVCDACGQPVLLIMNAPNS